MNLELKCIKPESALDYLREQKCNVDDKSAKHMFAISVVDGTRIHGVIVMNAEDECSLVHLFTDGTALVGSILYGAAWRASKALGYKSIIL